VETQLAGSFADAVEEARHFEGRSFAEHFEAFLKAVELTQAFACANPDAQRLSSHQDPVPEPYRAHLISLWRSGRRA
jgi:hypothetical protein